MELPHETITFEDLQNLIGELRSVARQLLSSERSPQSISPTGLAMTALRRAKLKDEEWEEVRWENRAHFFGALLRAMRHALIDRARRPHTRLREKSVPWDDTVLHNLAAQAEQHPDRWIALDEALAELQTRDLRSWEIIHQFYFVGYTVPEIAQFSGVSEKTVDRELKKARLTLRTLMERLPPSPR
jgi:RNA polymerase sigma factor (TIGR02999 family)